MEIVLLNQPFNMLRVKLLYEANIKRISNTTKPMHLLKIAFKINSQKIQNPRLTSFLGNDQEVTISIAEGTIVHWFVGSVPTCIQEHFHNLNNY